MFMRGGRLSPSARLAHMRAQCSWLLPICAAVACSCGRSNEPPKPASEPGAAASARPTGVISADALTSCAGFTTATAGAIVGAAPAELTDYSRTEGRLRICHYRNPSDRTKAVMFTLAHRPSVESAIASMTSERETMGSAQGAIDRAMGTRSKGAAVEDVSAIGDEAFYSPMNGAIMMRVGNVIVQVTAPADMALKKRTAEQVARGLRR